MAGGQLQLQRLVGNAGFDTPAQAGAAARQFRVATTGDSTWKRFVTVRGADNRYYVFEGSIVSRQVPAMDAAVGRPMHVFGMGFAQYHDGTAWRTVAESNL